MQATRLLVQVPTQDHFLVKGRTGHGAVDAPVETMVYAVKRVVHNGDRLPDVVRVLAWIPEPMRAYLVERSRMVDTEHAWVTANVKDNRSTLTPFMESGEYELSAPNAPGSASKRARVMVGELTGAVLDYWTGKALGLPVEIEGGQCHLTRVALMIPGVDTRAYSVRSPFRPSTDWKDGGALIERRRVGVYPDGGRWMARAESERAGYGVGETPLEAAARALVVGRYGVSVAAE
ncbi:phage protein NinX family protein [Burkholderia sp. KCJ3K979]|uniref:phage protein NinX family protein n=1 Tax=Burkholderia sp. KCJ3K979 TaxID=2759149 RepID=UPI001F44D84A|nr:phage protein NinX family protein [Burkholderia sp. KCJ3K979]